MAAMSNAQHIYGRDILFFRGINYEWEPHTGAYISLKGEERTLLASELSEALAESGFHPDSPEAIDAESELF